MCTRAQLQDAELRRYGVRIQECHIRDAMKLVKDPNVADAQPVRAVQRYWCPYVSPTHVFDDTHLVHAEDPWMHTESASFGSRGEHTFATSPSSASAAS